MKHKSSTEQWKEQVADTS